MMRTGANTIRPIVENTQKSLLGAETHPKVLLPKVLHRKLEIKLTTKVDS